MALRIGLYITAAMLIGAHFLREGGVAPLVICLVAPVLFFYRRRWVLVALQAMAYAASATWIVTLQRIVEQRRLVGRPWTAAALILIAVALLSLVAGLLLNSRSFRERYPR